MNVPRQPVYVPPVVKRKKSRSLLFRFFGFLFATAVIGFLGAAAVAGIVLWNASKDLPDYDKLATYEPPVMTRLHAADGNLIAEYARQRRLYVPINTIPKRVINAFLAAEDHNFYEHNGVDPWGILRAVYNNLLKKKREGASTITQQVAKNFLLTK